MEARTATSDGLTTGLITAGTRHVQITSASSANVVVLPASQQGAAITMYVGASGCRIETLASSNVKINDVDCDGVNNATIPASQMIKVTLMETDNWLLETWDDNGTLNAKITPG